MFTPLSTAQQLQARLRQEEIVISEKTALEWVQQFELNPEAYQDGGGVQTVTDIVRQDQRMKKITLTMSGRYNFSSVRIQYLNDLVGHLPRRSGFPK